MPMRFSVTATGATSYNWYVYDTRGELAYSWSSIRQHAVVSCEKTSEITITPTDTWLNGKVIRCTVKNSGGTVYTNRVSMTVTTPVTKGVTVSGTVKSFGSDTDDIMIQLIKQGQSEAAYEAVVNGNSTSYSIENVEIGTYTLKVIKKNHITREYTVNINSEDAIVNAEIFLMGDVNTDGKISVNDVTEAQQGIAELKELTDYQIKLADCDSDGILNVNDVTKLQTYIAGIIDEL